MDLTKQQLTLTLKPTLLDDKIELLKSYDEAEIGKVYTGVVAVGVFINKIYEKWTISHF